MSVTKELTIVVLMRFVITPRDPITAHVNQDMKKTEIIAQVIFFNLVILQANESKPKALQLLFFQDKMLFKAIIC